MTFVFFWCATIDRLNAIAAGLHEGGDCDA